MRTVVKVVNAAALGLLLGATLGAPALHAQGDLPEGWVVRADRPNADLSELAFSDMPPGWHVTTGPAAILYNPEMSAGGRFALELEVYLFDPGSLREAFGVFFGGRDLTGDGQAYLYFVIREGGEFLIKTRSGRNTSTIVEWTPHPSIRSFAELGEGESSQLNVLRVEAGEREVRFMVNGAEVTRIPRADLRVEGMVGLRVNHRLNLHVSRLEAGPLN